MIRLLAITVAIAAPSAALADPAAHLLASSVFAAETARTPAPAPRLPVQRAAKPKAQRAPLKLDIAERWEFRPARNYHARPDGFGLRGTKVGFFSTF